MKTDNVQSGSDVKSMLDDGARKAWESGQWKGKVTIHDLMKYLQTLGHLASVEEINAYVASSKEEDLDKPLTAKEIRERFGGKKSIEDIPMTRAATLWFNQQSYEGHPPASQNRGFWQMFVKRAKNDQLQVVLEVAKGLFQTIAKRQDQAAAGPDTTAGLNTGEMLSCMLEGCGCQGNPWQRKLIVNDRVLLHQDGPLKGQEVRVGNFASVKVGDKYETHFFCRDHVKVFVASGGATFCHEDAEAITVATNKTIEDAKTAAAKVLKQADALRQMALNSPAVAQKQRNQEVRQTVANNRTGNRRR